jgi:hypothetical protein
MSPPRAADGAANQKGSSAAVVVIVSMRREKGLDPVVDITIRALLR